MTTEKPKIERCPRCRGSVVTAEIEDVCTKCGMVIPEREVSLDYEEYGDENSRHGMPGSKLYKDSTIINKAKS